MKKTVFRFIYFLYILTVFILSILPLGSLASLNEHDKINHAIAFFILTGLGFLAYKFRYIYLFFIGLFFGVIIELFQSFTKYRSAEFLDLVADLSGIILAITVVFFYEFFFKKNKELEGGID